MARVEAKPALEGDATVSALRLILLAVGLAFLGYLVVQVGPETLLGSFRAISWRLLLIVWFPFALIQVLDTLGWRYAFRRDLTPFPTLLAVTPMPRTRPAWVTVSVVKSSHSPNADSWKVSRATSPSE